MLTPIEPYCIIKNNRCIVNGEEVFAQEQKVDHPKFLNDLYKYMGLSYPKFFKMDLLCKLGMLASEWLLKDLTQEMAEETGIYMTNKASSLQTDRKHFDNIKSKNAYFPSPSVFVYTLPNIVIGEISIKHKIMGEGIFFLTENHNFEWLKEYANLVLDLGISKQVLYGRLESDNDILEAHLILLRKDASTNTHL